MICADLRALVGDVDAAVLRRHLGELDDLVGRREAIGHVLQRRADPSAPCSIACATSVFICSSSAGVAAR